MAPETFGVEAAGGAAAIGGAIEAVQTVRLTDEIVDYLVALVRGTRDSGDLLVGASPRCGAMLARAARAWAVLQGRDYVTPDDVKFLALPTLRHRVTLSPAAEIEGRTADEAVKAVIERTPAPR
jgi:MoxR-like ATPase